jgi:NADPH:quinone reductase
MKNIMKALVCRSHGLPDTLAIESLDIAAPAAGEIRIKVAICSVNFPDALIIQNKYQFKPNLPFSPGSEVSGVVDAIGEGVENFKVGDRVFSICGWGGMAEYLIVEAQKTFLLPLFMSFEMGASLMYNFGTSFHALKDRAKLQANETILILGASGGVGIAAIQLAKIMGATVIAAASTPEKLAICAKNGADILINYETEDLKQRIKELTNGKGVNVVYDAVGDKYTDPALRSIAWEGRYLVVGFAAGQIPSIHLNLALLKGCAIIGVFWGKFAMDETQENLENIKQIAKWYEAGLLKVEVFKKYSLEESATAIQDMLDRKVIGKSLVICNAELASEKLAESKPSPSTKKIFLDKNQVKAAVGTELGVSSKLTITQKSVNQFANATLDHQWIHLDTSRAAETPFKSTIVHGFFTLSLSVYFLNEIYEIQNTSMGINYGCDKVRFIKPIKTNSEVFMKARLVSAEETSGNGLKLKIEASYYTDASDTPVCIAELLSIAYFTN